jgi:hypothetical protein
VNDLAEGRHAIDEDALATPIFAALRRSVRRDEHVARRSLRDPVDEFRRDPLTAPIPVQALVPAPARSAERLDGGRHHLDPVDSTRRT